DNQADTSLFLRFRTQGDAAALEVLVKRYLDSMYTVALRVLNKSRDAEDAVQNAVIRIMKAADKYDPQYPLKPWLLQKTADAARDLRRKQVSDRRRDMKQVPDSEAMTDNPLENLERAELESALADLDEDLQLPIILYYYEKMTQAEIGEMVGVSHQTVQKRIARGIDKLKSKLGVMGIAVTAAAVTSLLDISTVSAAPASLSLAVGSTIAANISIAAIGTAAVSGTAAASGVAGGKILAVAAAVGISCLAVGTQLPKLFSTTNKQTIDVEGLQFKVRKLEQANQRLNDENDKLLRMSAAGPAEVDLLNEIAGLKLKLEISGEENKEHGLELSQLEREYTAYRLGVDMAMKNSQGTDPQLEPLQPKGDYSQWEEAIRRDINDRKAIAGYRKALTEHKDFAYGVGFYEELIKEHADAAILQVEIGTLKISIYGTWLYQRKRNEIPEPTPEQKVQMGITVIQGLSMLNRAIKSDPDNRFGVLVRARFAYQFGETDAALKDLQHLYDLYQENPQDEDRLRLVYKLLIRAAADLKQLDLAYKYWENAINDFSTDMDLYNLKNQYNDFRD
ncbi:sigma-70 family RNA polymerase sigma factor, partial [Planctomycetota bacterium]